MFLSCSISQPDLGHTLCKSMNVRYLEIVKRTANRKQNESLEFMSRLANMERQRQTRTGTYAPPHSLLFVPSRSLADVRFCMVVCFSSVFDSKAAGLLQLKKLHDRSSVQLCIAPVLAALQSYANSAANVHAQNTRAHGGAAAASTSERRITSTNASRGRDPNALRNITNGQGGGGSAARATGGATQSTPHPTKPPTSSVPASTLARLKESSENNRPLASHESMRFGMAATQARQAAKAHRDTQMGYESTQAPPPTNTQPMPAAQSRKRKSVQNK